MKRKVLYTPCIQYGQQFVLNTGQYACILRTLTQPPTSSLWLRTYTATNRKNWHISAYRANLVEMPILTSTLHMDIRQWCVYAMNIYLKAHGPTIKLTACICNRMDVCGMW